MSKSFIYIALFGFVENLNCMKVWKYWSGLIFAVLFYVGKSEGYEVRAFKQGWGKKMEKLHLRTPKTLKLGGRKSLGFLPWTTKTKIFATNEYTMKGSNQLS